MRKSTLIGLLGCCLLVLMCNSAFGQATASSGIQGTIVDKSQAAITGAEVVVTNKATGAARTTKTNEMGAYRLDLLPAGVYTVKATASGFSTAEAKEVELLVGSTTTQNLTLAAGNVSETAEVIGAAPL